MEHWGDPWADNAHDHKPPTENTVPTPQPPTYTPTPVLLNGFLDDAGWGNEEAGLDDWTTSTGKLPHASTTTEAIHATAPDLSTHTSEDAHWETAEKSELPRPTGNGSWSGSVRDVSPELDNVISETSDASTTIPLHIPHHNNTTIAIGPPQPDDSSSARPSTSPSETSHHEIFVESSRTSVEEENRAEKHGAVEHSSPDEISTLAGEEAETHILDTTSLSSEGVEVDIRHISEGALPIHKSWNPTESPYEFDPGLNTTPKEADLVNNDSLRAAQLNSAVIHTGTVDLHSPILEELFPVGQDLTVLADAPDDPIYAISGRKAWYRLTRKQTMREHNSGNADDNYIRVTWGNSTIRSEVNNVVGRWAREDLISGTGPGARASFYWDTQAPVEPRASSHHPYRNSTTHIQPVAVPVRQGLPPVAGNPPAAFDWSSSHVSIDPSRLDEMEGRVTILPKVLTVDPLAPVQTESLRKVSIDATPTISGEQHQQISKTAFKTRAASESNPPHINSPHTPTLDLRADFDTLSTSEFTQELYSGVLGDDDDDWGEMVSTPTVSNPTTAKEDFEVMTRNDTPSTLLSEAPTASTSPAQNLSMVPTHASTIVRLQSTISPTSALFGAKHFIPLHTEKGPVGPSILKPVKKAAVPTSESARSKVQTIPGPESYLEQRIQQTSSLSDVLGTDQLQHAEISQSALNKSLDGDFSVFESSTPEASRTSTLTPPVRLSIQQDATPWTNTDLSFFDTAAQAAPLSQALLVSLDTFSVFETLPGSTKTAHSTLAVSRSPSRHLTPPPQPQQPLTGGINSTRQRETEENSVIANILHGLPDLSYMLR